MNSVPGDPRTQPEQAAIKPAPIDEHRRPGGPASDSAVMPGRDTEPEQPEWTTSWRARISLLLAALVVVVAISVAALRSSPSARHGNSGPAVHTGVLTVRYVAPWHPSAAPVSGAGRIAAGVLDAHPAVLADAGVTALAGPLRQSDAVPGGAPPELVSEFGMPASARTSTVAAGLAKRYIWNLPGHESLAAFVLPTETSDLAILCVAGSADLATSSCETVAREADVARAATIVPPGANPALQASLARALRPIAKARLWLAGKMDHEPIRGRAAPLARVSGVEQAAGAKLSNLRVAPRSDAAVAGLTAALGTEASALDQLAAAARSNRTDRYNVAVTRVRAAAGQLESAERALTAEGFSLPSLSVPTLEGTGTPRSAVHHSVASPVSSGSSGTYGPSAQSSAPDTAAPPASHSPAPSTSSLDRLPAGPGLTTTTKVTTTRQVTTTPSGATETTEHTYTTSTGTYNPPAHPSTHSRSTRSGA